MPRPIPADDEMQRDFISRCMGDETMNAEYGDRSTRAAQCFTAWRSNKGKSLAVADIGAEVKTWLESEIRGKPGTDEPEGGEYIHYRIKDPALFIEGSFRIVDIVKEKPRVKSTMGKLKPDGTTMVKQNLMFPTEDDWTLAKAKAWVAAHPDAAKAVMPAREKGVRYETWTKIKQESLKASDNAEDAGWIEGYAAYFNNVDLQNEVILPGAFAKTISERIPAGKVKLMVKHIASGGDTLDVAGTITEAREDEKGLWIHAELSGSAKAQSARELVNEGHVAGLSIGYKILKSEPGTFGGQDVLFLKEMFLAEVTIVPVPANDMAQIGKAKEMQSGASESSDRARSEAESALLAKARAARLAVLRKRLALLRIT